MGPVSLICDHCGKSFFRTSGRVNEGKKFGWKFYCSHACQGMAKKCQDFYSCVHCGEIFERPIRFVKDLKKVYCSRSCAASVNNVNFPKRKVLLKDCIFCGKEFRENDKYCSRKCKNASEIVSADEILGLIKDFFGEQNRIPLKNEFVHNKAARVRFGSWNKAIIAAGYSPNPVRFAKKYIAKDGHKCDSMAERIIDDWFFRRGIEHQRQIPYPTRKELTVDFLVGDKWVEFFGLSGQLKKYDLLKDQKIQLVKELKLNLVEIYPQDLNKLEELLLRDAAK